MPHFEGLSPGDTLAVAVSGGADSLLALALAVDLARKAEAWAVGLHAHFLPPGEAAARLEGELAALCERLGARFHAVDLSREFQRLVITPFADAYKAGLTPNPCVDCNARMKFGLLLDAARDLGAGRLATGHYAALETGAGGGPRLFRGADPSRDQSYFLARVPAERLARAVFPLAARRKTEVREQLARRGLAAPLPRESREICFIPGDDYRAFLAARGDMPGPGEAVFADGKPAGRHRGLWRHTIGQRRGLGIAHAEPLYVLAKQAKENRLVVGVKNELPVAGFRVEAINFLAAPDTWPESIGVQTCYRQRPKPLARIDWDSDGAATVFPGEPVERPAPGQAAVFYAGDEVLGGGWIAQE
ncbi:MAG: tRNA 2-thiouridine(34) synthase MnmA [Desulfovibrionaceae bacterium]|nr:tRNA 2-thiouridine(34) synthase MnmA [Desulfovibrionaceae bacterium]MBF0515005.1 tRNA 2-thiouridine(34) synthase MnmA [Desulfovibrionaceae bacterium]